MATLQHPPVLPTPNKEKLTEEVRNQWEIENNLTSRKAEHLLFETPTNAQGTSE